MPIGKTRSFFAKITGPALATGLELCYDTPIIGTYNFRQ